MSTYKLARTHTGKAASMPLSYFAAAGAAHVVQACTHTSTMHTAPAWARTSGRCDAGLHSPRVIAVAVAAAHPLDERRQLVDGRVEHGQQQQHLAQQEEAHSQAVQDLWQGGTRVCEPS